MILSIIFYLFSLGKMDDFAEAVLQLQTYEKVKSAANWKEIVKILNSYYMVQNYIEENEVIKNLCNEIFDEEFLKILSDQLVKIENIDKIVIESINLILSKFDPKSRERRIVESCLREHFENLEISEIGQRKKFQKFELTENFIMKKPEIKANLIKGSYNSLEEYLAVQRTLIIEDFIRPLRQGLTDIKSRCVQWLIFILLFEIVTNFPHKIFTFIFFLTQPELIHKKNFWND